MKQALNIFVNSNNNQIFCCKAFFWHLYHMIYSNVVIKNLQPILLYFFCLQSNMINSILKCTTGCPYRHYCATVLVCNLSTSLISKTSDSSWVFFYQTSVLPNYSWMEGIQVCTNKKTRHFQKNIKILTKTLNQKWASEWKYVL